MPETGGRRHQRYNWLAGALEDGGIVLTASRRLARELRAAFNEAAAASGLGAWKTPGIFYWHDWARRVAMENANADSPVLLDRNASAVLWERCLRKQLDEDLLGLGGLTRQAMSAWSRLVEWRIPLADADRAASTQDEQLFARAAADYQRLLDKGRWIDAPQVMPAAIRNLEAGCSLPSRVLLAGFDRITPLAQWLLQVLQHGGCEAQALQPGDVSGALNLQSYIDVEAELRAAGAWAGATLDRDPAAKIAIISSDLNASAARYARLIREGLAPGWQTAGSAHRHAVNVSFGRRLADYPAIAAALLCLRWIGAGLGSREVSILLRSGFIGSDDAMGGADLDLQLRLLPDRQWSAAALVEALTQAGIGAEPDERLMCFRHIAAQQINASVRRPPSTWAATVHELLTQVGWPGSGTFDSEEFQLVNRWRELLNELAGLDTVLPQTTLADAVARLTSLAREAVYQPETGAGLVSLVGTLEAAGMEFDHLWVLGTDAGRWPAPGHPLSLVSRRLQRDRGLPDATSADSLAYSQRVLHRLAASAGSVFCSWARTESDTLQMPSPLLDAFRIKRDTESIDPGWYAGSLAGGAQVKGVQVDPPPGVDGVEKLAGGARVIALHWQEPFAAFAVGRLGVGELGRFQAGLSPRLRGNILHDALEGLMRDRPSQELLRSWSGHERQSRIERSIGHALAKPEQHADAVLRRLLALERLRLRQMLTAFLDAENNRAPFRVERVEQKIGFIHAGLQLELRADRIDRLADGQTAIIDYKSGAPKKLLDADGNPVEPQLIVYAAATDDTVGGLVLINISRRAIEYRGAGSEWGSIESGAWPDTLARWKGRVLTSLEAIAAGDVRISLHPGEGAGQQLDVLSRIEEERRGR
jgi:probable DNA repair protein